MPTLEYVREETWQMRAACRGPQSSFFFPPPWATERREDRVARESCAKEICAQCGVKRQCLDYAISIHEMHGIWGGLNETERRRILEAQAS